MPINNSTIQLGTAVKPVHQVESLKGTTFLADVMTDQGRKQAYLKLLKVEDIAREALCATLARMLGLPIKQAYYVNVDPSYIEGRKVGNPYHTAFGLEKDRFVPTFRLKNQSLELLPSQWPESTLCAIFDEWIFNNDRLPNNLIFDHGGVYWLIDHDEALPNFAKPNMAANSSLLHIVSKSKSEFELWEIRKRAMVFVQQAETINWDQVLEFLSPKDLPTSEGYYSMYIEFLRNRLPALVDIVSVSIGIRQQQLELEAKQHEKAPITEKKKDK